MAKKRSKRPNLSQETLERARAELRGDRPEPVAAAPVIGANGVAEARVKTTRRNPTLATRRAPTMDELIAEYAYVPRELRNMAILAISLMALIVVAAIALPRLAG